MEIYFAVVGGIVISVLLPIIRAFLPKPPTVLNSTEKWQVVRPYVATGVFAIIAGLLVVAFLGDVLDSWTTALLAGYTWDSTLQKATTGNVAAPGT